jgi:hypothetical protein
MVNALFSLFIILTRQRVGVNWNHLRSETRQINMQPEAGSWGDRVICIPYRSYKTGIVIIMRLVTKCKLKPHRMR